MSRYTIRKANKDDVAAIADLSSALNQSEGMTQWHRPDEDSLREHLDMVDVYLAEQDGQVVGYIAGFTHFNLHNSYMRYNVSSVFVYESHRRQGIGAELLKTLMLEKKDEGIRQFAIDTKPYNKDACALWEKIGFEKRDPGFNNYRLGFEALERFYKDAA